MRFYVNIFSGENKVDGFDCKDPMTGLAALGSRAVAQTGFEFSSAACYLWEPDKLPERQWLFEVD